MTHRIQIEPTTIRGERGQYYRVHFEDAVLIDETWNPELEACRVLSLRASRAGSRSGGSAKATQTRWCQTLQRQPSGR
jgi:hypothetical protein